MVGQVVGLGDWVTGWMGDWLDLAGHWMIVFHGKESTGHTNRDKEAKEARRHTGDDSRCSSLESGSVPASVVVGLVRMVVMV